MGSRKRTEILSDLQQAKDALIASEKRGRRAVQRLRQLEGVLEKVKWKMEAWAALPVSDESQARCLTTGEVRAILALLKEQDEVKDEPAADH